MLAINQTGSATSTFTNGIQLTGGCFRTAAGTCLTAIAPGGTDGQVQYNNGGSFGGGTDFIWDDTNNRLGIGTSSPWAQLSINPSGLTGPAFAVGSSTATAFVVAPIYGAAAFTSSTTVYSTAGTSTFTVPTGVTTVQAKVWGAGGAGGGAADGNGSTGGNGGGGGYATGVIKVTPGQSLTVEVGGAGALNATRRSGGGGGYSAVKSGSTFLVQAGGGGGGGAGETGLAAAVGGAGGAGGGESGSAGAAGSGGGGDNGNGGQGGTQTTGGAGGTGGGTGTDGAAGAANAGGNGGASGTCGSAATGCGGSGGGTAGESGGGGGGGGKFGGGGGENSQNNANSGGGGGGGGSSGFDSSVHATSTTAGSGTTPGNNSDANYGGNAGVGGTGNTTEGNVGNPGRVVFLYAADGSHTHSFAVGIGTTSPFTAFSIKQNNNSYAGGLALSSTGNVYRSLWLNDDGAMFFENGSNLASLSTAGTWTSASDSSYKENIIDLTYGLETALALQPRAFTYKAGGRAGVGFIAQELETIIPEVVYGENGRKTVDYGTLSTVALSAIQELAGALDVVSALSASSTLISSYTGTSSPAITVDTYGKVGIGNTLPAYALHVSGDVAASGFVNTSTRDAKKNVSYLSDEAASSTLAKLKELKVATYHYEIEGADAPARMGLIAEDLASAAPEILSVDKKGVDLYKLATFTLTGVQALAEKVDVQEARVTSLEERLAKLESGEVAMATSTNPFSTSTLKSALESFGIFIEKGLAQFNALVFRELIAGKDEDGTSSAGTATILEGNTVVEIVNALVKPSTKIFITFNSPVSGSWHVSNKKEGSFRVELARDQTRDVSFDYFLVQTEKGGTTASSSPSQTPPSVTQSESGNSGAPSQSSSPAESSAATAPSATTTTPVATTTEPAAAPQAGAPTVSLVGAAAIEVLVGGTFTDPGAKATDETDGDLTAHIIVSGTVDTAIAGLYTRTYTATNSAGKSASVSRVVTVKAGGGSAATSTPSSNGPASATEPATPNEQASSEPTSPDPSPEPTQTPESEITPEPEPASASEPEPTSEPSITEPSA